MQELIDIIDELNLENGSNYKVSVLKKYSNREDFKLLLKLAYDRVTYTFGIRKIPEYTVPSTPTVSLLEGLEILRDGFATREVTGNAAQDLLQETLSKMSQKEGYLLRKVINRDLRINLGRTSINKVFKGLIVKPIYMRCGIYNDKTKKNISFPAIIQLKADGTYREFIVENGQVKSHTRAGESHEYPPLFEALKSAPDGVYMGELLVNGITDRAEGNGMINSSDVPYDDLIFETWDYVTLEEYTRAGLKDRKNPCTTRYEDRFTTLVEIVRDLECDQIRVINTDIVESLEAAAEFTSAMMNMGLEGAVIKDLSGVFRDGTSKHQLKMKLAFTVEVRVTGFIEGTPGTKREKTFGSLTYSTDDGMIEGSVSGFTDDQLNQINADREGTIGRIMEVEANDLTQARHKNTFALSHPRFIEFRDDRTDTDTLERAREALESAKQFKE